MMNQRPAKSRNLFKSYFWAVFSILLTLLLVFLFVEFPKTCLKVPAPEQLISTVETAPPRVDFPRPSEFKKKRVPSSSSSSSENSSTSSSEDSDRKYRHSALRKSTLKPATSKRFNRKQQEPAQLEYPSLGSGHSALQTFLVSQNPPISHSGVCLSCRDGSISKHDDGLLESTTMKLMHSSSNENSNEDSDSDSDSDYELISE